MSPLRLDYSLENLPSAQHRAGLAGLVLLAQWLAPVGSGILQVLSTDAAGASVALDRCGLEALLGEVQAGAPVPGSKAGGPGTFMASLEPMAADGGGHAEGEGPWTRLWKDWFWEVHLNSPRAREPFEAWARGGASKAVAKVWAALRAQGAEEPGAGTLLGGIPLTLDNVPVRDTAAQRFLLLFSPFATSVGLLRRHRAWGGRPDLDGFVAVLPDIRDLDGFLRAFPPAMRGRSPERTGPRPREAGIDHPMEAALDFARRLERPRAEGFLAVAYEVHHARIQGRTPRLQAVHRLEPAAALLEAYAAFRSLGYGDPLFRRMGVRNLVEGLPWHTGFQELFDPPGCLRRTIQCEPFRRDVRLAFRVAKRGTDPGGAGNRLLEATVKGAATQFVLNRVRAESGLGLEEAAGNPDRMVEFQDMRHRVALETFRRARERSGDAFASFFTQALLPEALSISPEGRRWLGDSLAGQPRLVRLLTLLALAAVA